MSSQVPLYRLSNGGILIRKVSSVDRFLAISIENIASIKHKIQNNKTP
jgi:hypothetical protein